MSPADRRQPSRRRRLPCTRRSFPRWLAAALSVLIMRCSNGTFCASLDGCRDDPPLTLDAKDIPGTYVMSAHGRRDEINLDADRTVRRFVTDSSGQITQTGKWKEKPNIVNGAVRNTVVDFSQLTPCDAADGGSRAAIRLADGSSPLCSGEGSAFFCRHDGFTSLCFDESTHLRFHLTRRSPSNR